MSFVASLIILDASPGRAQTPSPSPEPLPTGPSSPGGGLLPMDPAALEPAETPPPPAAAYPTPRPTPVAGAPIPDEQNSTSAIPLEQSQPTPAPLPTPVFSPNSLNLVSDRGAQAFDPTTRGGGSSFSPGSNFPQTNAAGRSGPFSLSGTLGVNEIAYQESGEGISSNGWAFSTQLLGSIQLTLGLPQTGRYLNVIYSGSVDFGGQGQTTSGFQNGSVNQAVDLLAHLDFSKLKLSLSADYARDTGPDRDVGLAVNRNLTTASLDAAYPVFGQTSSELTLEDSDNDYGTEISSNTVDVSLFLNRQLSQKTSIGLGGTFGTLTVDGGQNQTFEQASMHLSYSPDVKFSFAASVGYEWREIGNVLSSTPVFNGSISYIPRPTTSFSLNASRAVSNSAIEAQTNYTSTTVRISASQTIATKFSASLSLGYQNSEYSAVGSLGNGSRNDNLLYVEPELSFRVATSFSINLYYSYDRNLSNKLSFTAEQVSIGGTYSF